MEPEPHKGPIRFYEIDLLRFLAALSVVFYHYTYRGYSEGHFSPVSYVELGRFTKYGYLGVELFFIISGYVVLLSAQGKTVRQFFISRITRLYPAFWAACTLTFLVKRLAGFEPASNLHAGLGQYACNMSMLHEFVGVTAMDTAYWSLTVEITFYFLISLLIGYGLLHQVDWVLTAWLGYSLLPGLAHAGTPFATLLFPAYAPYFAAGMLFYLLQQPHGRTWHRYALLLLSYGLALRSGASQADELSRLFQDSFSHTVVWGAITGFFGVFYLVAFRKIDLARFSWLAWWGSLTYPLYLIHSDVAYVAFQRIGHLFNKYALLSGLVLSILVIARFIHVLVEKRLSKALGSQIDNWLTRLA